MSRRQNRHNSNTTPNDDMTTAPAAAAPSYGQQRKRPPMVRGSSSSMSAAFGRDTMPTTQHPAMNDRRHSTSNDSGVAIARDDDYIDTAPTSLEGVAGQQQQQPQPVISTTNYQSHHFVLAPSPFYQAQVDFAHSVADHCAFGRQELAYDAARTITLSNMQAFQIPYLTVPIVNTDQDRRNFVYRALSGNSSSATPEVVFVRFADLPSLEATGSPRMHHECLDDLDRRENCWYAGQIFSELAVPENHRWLIGVFVFLMNLPVKSVSAVRQSDKNHYTFRIYFEDAVVKQAAVFLANMRLFMTYDWTGAAGVLLYLNPGAIDQTLEAAKAVYRSPWMEPRHSFRCEDARTRGQQSVHSSSQSSGAGSRNASNSNSGQGQQPPSQHASFLTMPHYLSSGGPSSSLNHQYEEMLTVSRRRYELPHHTTPAFDHPQPSNHHHDTNMGGADEKYLYDTDTFLGSLSTSSVNNNDEQEPHQQKYICHNPYATHQVFSDPSDRSSEGPMTAPNAFGTSSLTGSSTTRRTSEASAASSSSHHLQGRPIPPSLSMLALNSHQHSCSTFDNNSQQATPDSTSRAATVVVRRFAVDTPSAFLSGSIRTLESGQDAYVVPHYHQHHQDHDDLLTPSLHHNASDETTAPPPQEEQDEGMSSSASPQWEGRHLPPRRPTTPDWHDQ